MAGNRNSGSAGGSDHWRVSVETVQKTGSDSAVLGIAVAHLLFAERTFDAAGDRVTNPDDGTQEDNG